MSVLIRGMKMPESCHECVAGYGGFCFVASAESDGICPDHGRPDDCPLIELPTEHGRLIDVDEASRRFPAEADPRNGYMLYKLNNELSTIIEAEEGE